MPVSLVTDLVQMHPAEAHACSDVPDGAVFAHSISLTVHLNPAA